MFYPTGMNFLRNALLGTIIKIKIINNQLAFILLTHLEIFH